MHVISRIGKYPGYTFFIFKTCIRNQCGKEHDSLGKNDRHNTSTVHLQWQELPCATELPVTNNLLGIIHRNFAYTLYQYDQSENDSNKDSNFNYKNQNTTTTHNRFC